MNICLITSTLPPVTGGLETHVGDLARALARRGHGVAVIGFRNWGKERFPAREVRDGVTIHREWDTVLPVYYFRYKLFCIRAAVRGWRLHRRSPFDLVHAHQEYPAGVAGALLGRAASLPLFITCHGSSLVSNWRVPWLRPPISWALRRATRVIAVGAGLRDQIVAGGVDPGRVTVLSNFVDTERFSSATPGVTRGGLRGRQGWANDAVVVFFVGRLHPAKGPDHFVEMALLLLERDPSLKFLLAGTGGMEAELKTRVRSAGKEGAFAFAGEIPHGAIPAFLADADVLVVPSRSEAGGLSCLEGMAMGKAVVASRVGGLAEVIRDGEDGFLIDPGTDRFVSDLAEAVYRLARDPSLRARLGERARRAAETRFGPEAYLNRLLGLYREGIGHV